MFPLKKNSFTGWYLLLIILFIITVLSVMVTRDIFSDKQSEDVWKKNRDLLDLKGQIIYLDEVLTMSARMAAATGNPEWEKRYRFYEKELDSTLNKTSIFLPPSWNRDFVNSTSVANAKLVAMENKAFEFVHAHKTDSAQLILSGSEYEYQKGIYKTGVLQLLSRLENYKGDFLKSYEKDKQISRWIYSGGLLLLLLVFYFLIKEIFRSNRMKKLFQEQGEHLRVTLSSLTEGVITTDSKGEISFMNSSAENLTGWKYHEAKRQPLLKIFNVTNEETGKPFENIVSRILKDGKTIHLENNTILQTKDACRIVISNNGSPLRDHKENIIGAVLVFSDLTEQKKAEKSLHESEIKYRTLFENMSEGIYKSSPEGKFLEVNPAMVKMFGYASREEMMTIDIKSDLYFQEEDRSAAINQNNINGLDVFRLRKKDDSEIWVEDSGKYISDENGKLIYHEGVLRDVTKRRKTELELAESKSQLLNILNLEPECIKLLDADNKILKINPAGVAMIEAKDEQSVLGLSVLEVINEQYYEAFLKLTTDIFNGKSGKIQFEITGLKGTHRWLETHAVPMRNQAGEVISLLGVTRDITENKKYETEMKNLTTRLLLATNSAKIGIFDWDITKNNLVWDENMYKIFGVAPDKFSGAFEAWSATLHPDDLQAALTEVQSAIEGTEDFHTYFRILWSHNEVRYVEGDAIILRDGNGKALRMIGVNRDITEQKEAEQKLEQKNKELLKTNSELDRFVYSTSHDLRAPLKSLLGLADLIKEDIAQDNQTQHERMQMMKKSVVKLDNFIEDILHYSRNTRTEVAKEEINFKEIIQEIRGSHKFMEGAKGLNLKVEMHAGEKFISDKRRMNVILNNLISNAIKYQDASKENPWIEIFIRCNKENAVIVIEDNGIGIAAKDKEKIFEMFYRATKYSTGSGLGLYIVKETIEKLGGTVTLESELNKGAKFIVTLPNLNANLN